MIIEKNRKQYPSLDIAKFIMALLILTQHTCNEWAHSTGLVHALFGLGNFAVPFFFACSGYLFFSKYSQLTKDKATDYYRHWSKRIWKMYLVWSLIYLGFVINSWFSNGFTWERPLIWLHRSLVYSTYATIWFLPALWIGVTICLWMKEHVSFRTSAIIIATLMIIGNLFGSYSNIITIPVPIRTFYDWYMSVFITWRNGVFNGAPYVFIGTLIVYGYGKNLGVTKSAITTIIFSLAFIAEAFCIIHFHLSRATDMGFMMAPSIFFMMNTLVNWQVGNRTLWIHLRNMSMLIFLGQRLFLSAIPGVWPVMTQWIQSFPSGLIYSYFIIIVIAFAIIIEQLSNRFKFLKILW